MNYSHHEIFKSCKFETHHSGGGSSSMQSFEPTSQFVVCCAKVVFQVKTLFVLTCAEMQTFQVLTCADFQVLTCADFQVLTCADFQVLTRADFHMCRVSSAHMCRLSRTRVVDVKRTRMVVFQARESTVFKRTFSNFQAHANVKVFNAHVFWARERGWSSQPPPMSRSRAGPAPGAARSTCKSSRQIGRCQSDRLSGRAGILWRVGTRWTGQGRNPDI